MAATSCLFLITGECLTDNDIGPLSELIILGVHAWDTSSMGFDINEELNTFVSSNPSPQSYNANEKGESVIRVFSDKLCVAALINPGLFTLASQLEWLLQTPFANRHLVFAGRQSDELGDWLLKDASVSPARLGQMLRSAPDASLPPDHRFSISCAVNAAGSGWKSAKSPLTEFRAHAASQQSELDQSTVPGAVQLAGFLAGKQCGLASVEQRLRPAGTVGNIRIAKPTLYVFPAGLGDSCYLGVDGFGLLVNTGAGRTPAFWPFLAHLDRVDGLLLSHWDHDNLPGLLALLERLSAKEAGGVPILGCALLPCRPRLSDEASSSPDAPAANGDQHRLEASIRRDAVSAMRLFRGLGVHLEEVRRLGTGQPQPMTLYSKLGNGALDLYPLQPVADAKEFKDFVSQLLHSQAASAGGKPWPLSRVGNCHASPAHANSLCCLLVWRPNDPKLHWTRLLLPGCCPQLRVIEGLEKVRGLDCLKSAEYAPATAAAAAHKPASAAAKKPTAASGDHAGPSAAAAAKPRTRPAASAAPAAKKTAPAPIVKKPVSSSGDPGKTSANKSSTTAAAAASKSSASASSTAKPAGGAAKKDPAKAGSGAVKSSAAAKPTAAALRKPAPGSAASAKPAAAARAAPTASAAPAAATSPSTAEETLVTEQHQPEVAAAVEEIQLSGDGDASQETGAEAEMTAEHQDTEQQQEGDDHQEAWALNANNTNSAEADSADLISVDQPLGLPAPAPAKSAKSSGAAAAASVNYGPVHPLHFDLAYVPGRGERQFADSEYFKRVRARHYVLSSCDPQPAVLDSLLEGKLAWPELETTLIPTHSNQLVTAWLAQYAERMQQLHVTVAPSASDCRIRLQQQGDEADEQACTAYRVEF